MEQKYNDIIGTREKQLDEWHNSQEYKELCAQFSAEANHLVEIGDLYIKCIDKVESTKDSITVRREVASDSSMNRGFYCPSLVYDIVVGKVKRGKLLKKTPLKGRCFLYGFDLNDKVIWVKRMRDGKSTYTEYLFYDSCFIYGLTVDMRGILQEISMEQYDGDRLIRYEYAILNDNTCARIWKEDYEYDDAGLSCSVFSEYYPHHNFYRASKYFFVRENGYLTHYTVKKLNGVSYASDGHYYEICKKRKA